MFFKSLLLVDTDLNYAYSRVLRRNKSWLALGFQVKVCIGTFSKTKNCKFTRHAIKKPLWKCTKINI